MNRFKYCAGLIGLFYCMALWADAGTPSLQLVTVKSDPVIVADNAPEPNSTVMVKNQTYKRQTKVQTPYHAKAQAQKQQAKTESHKKSIASKNGPLEGLDTQIHAAYLEQHPHEVTALPPIKTVPNKGSVALTFDDGPDPRFTPKILDILDQYHIKATFFVVGTNAHLYPHLIEDIQKRGHHIENHTMTHPFLTHVSTLERLYQIDKNSDIIQSITNVKPVCFRPPFGAHNSKIDHIANDDGMHVVLWDVDSTDWKKPGIPVIVSRVLKEVRPGSVILFHDGGGNRSQTVSALPMVIEALQKKNLQFDSICQIGPAAARKG